MTRRRLFFLFPFVYMGASAQEESEKNTFSRTYNDWVEAANADAEKHPEQQTTDAKVISLWLRTCEAWKNFKRYIDHGYGL